MRSPPGEETTDNPALIYSKRLRNMKDWYKIIEIDNFVRDWPGDEIVVNLPLMSYDAAKSVSAAINNACSGDMAQRFWLVVPADYVEKTFRPVPKGVTL